jgi:hypothetical protein
VFAHISVPEVNKNKRKKKINCTIKKNLQSQHNCGEKKLLKCNSGNLKRLMLIDSDPEHILNYKMKENNGQKKTIPIITITY